MDNWNVVDPHEAKEDPYAADCGSRAAEGFYVGALYGSVWGLIGCASAAPILPSTPAVGAVARTVSDSKAPPLAGFGDRGAVRHRLRGFGRSAAGLGVTVASTAGVFGVFVGMVNAGTCACERFRGKKDWVNNACGGAVAGLSVALLSRHTRTPRMVVAHVAGAAAITSMVAFATGPPVGS